MIVLTDAVKAWGGPDFNAVLKTELEGLDKDALPLQAGLSTGSYVTDRPRQAMIIRVTDSGDVIRATAGIFYTGVLTGCACADDPTPVNEESEYCEVELEIDKSTGRTTVKLVGD